MQISIKNGKEKAICSDGGFGQHDRYWYLSRQNTSCGRACQDGGLIHSNFVVGDEESMVPQLLRKEPALKLSAWGHIECDVQGEGIGEDKYHTAQNTLTELDKANIPIHKLIF